MQIEENVILKEFTTFKCGGPARYFARPSSVEELIECIQFCKKENIDRVILGACSNVLISDKGFDGMVIRFDENFANMSISIDTDRGVGVIDALCGAKLSTLGMQAMKQGLTGAEFACGIPGSIGGAIFMNAGAFGGEIKDIVTSVDYIDSNLVLQTLDQQACRFAYRHSAFMDELKDAIILGARFELKIGDQDQIKTCVNELRQKRVLSQPVDVPSAGSTFKRPCGNFAAALIQECELKGFKLDESGAQVSPKHTGFIVNNHGSASASDVKKLIKYVSNKVYKETGVRLEPEVRYIGDFD